MVFSSLLFIFLFLPLNLVFYYSVDNKKLKNVILVIFSLIFYAWGEPIWITLMFLSALVDYLNGLFIEKNRNTKISLVGVIISVIFNMGLLISFKYSDFIVENVNYLLSLNLSKPGFLLPIGISFYSFQTLSYTIDVYKGEVKAQKKFLNFLLFVSLYHQLVAGPIVRYSHIATEIDSRTFEWNDFSNGVSRFCIGLFKKVYIANIAGALCAHFLEQDISLLSFYGAWFGILLFSLQIYFDFSGYSDMAIGLGFMFGFHYHENFNYPYIATSITDFWRRWHISLGTFFRDYVYIPMGGNKHNQTINIFSVWLLTGLWHGASWNFIIWGLYYAIILYIEKKLLFNILLKTPIIIKHIYSLFLIMIGWAIFYFTDMSKLKLFLTKAFDFTDALSVNFDVKNLFYENSYWLLFSCLMCMPIYYFFFKKVEQYIKNQNVVFLIKISINISLFFVSISLLVGNSYNPFLYFRF